MIGNYKDFYNFVNIKNPYLIELWEDINNRPSPKEGDLFEIECNISDSNYNSIYAVKTCEFIKVEFDKEFENGVAFYYIFKYNDDIVKVHSINYVYDTSKLTMEDQFDLYGFWTKCKPLNKD